MVRMTPRMCRASPIPKSSFQESGTIYTTEITEMIVETKMLIKVQSLLRPILKSFGPQKVFTFETVKKVTKNIRSVNLVARFCPLVSLFV